MERFTTIQVDRPTHALAKRAAKEAGQLLRRWLADAVKEKAAKG